MAVETSADRTMMWVAVGLFALGFGTTIAMGVSTSLLRASDGARVFFLYAPAVALPVGLLAYRRLRAVALRWRLGLAAVAFVGTALLFGSTLLLVNQIADASPATRHAAKIVRKDHSKNGYFIVVESWLSPGETFDVWVLKDRWNALGAGDTIDVDMHDGRFGLPWVEKLR